MSCVAHNRRGLMPAIGGTATALIDDDTLQQYRLER